LTIQSYSVLSKRRKKEEDDDALRFEKIIFYSTAVASYKIFEIKKMSLKIYMTNITSNQLIIGNQRKLKHILDTNKINYIDIDISDSKNSNEKEFLQRTLASLNQKMILPQIFHDEQYCCDFDGLISAVESNTLKQVLKLDYKNDQNGN
jgi:hypothetical protein